MMMMMKLLHVPAVMAVMSALVVTNSGHPAAPAALWWTTTGSSGLNLNGKMFTLSNRGSVSFYPPYYFSPTPTPWPSNTRYTTDQPTTNYPDWTTAPPTRGVSVCLRYIADYQALENPTIFTLSPSRTPLKLQVSNSFGYLVYFGGYSNNMYLRPTIRFWPNIGLDIWNRVCIIVDSVKNVAQVFTGSSMSIRKMLPARYVWSGEPVIEFPGFDGQVTDVQVWDYPLRYREISKYMTSNVYGPYSGTVLTWSSIGYSPRGKTLLEDVYEWQAKQPISSKRRGRRPRL